MENRISQIVITDKFSDSLLPAESIKQSSCVVVAAIFEIRTPGEVGERNLHFLHFGVHSSRLIRGATLLGDMLIFTPLLC